MTMRHILNISDLSVAELREVLALAQTPVSQLGMPYAGHALALIFEKPSNRTRQSMEVATVQLGGHPIYTRGEEVGIDTRETAEDVARVMAGYHAVIAARVFKHDVVQRMALVSGVPVLNMLSDYSHPLQGLADVLTMEQQIGDLRGKKIAWVGDYNNVARSLAEACVMLGATVSIATPVGYGPSEAELKRINVLGEGEVTATVRTSEAVEGAVCVHTDVWVSMGQEAQTAAKEAIFQEYKVTAHMMSLASPEALFFHCLPAHRGYEVDADVIDGSTSRVVEQAHNRLHSARGLLAFIAKVQPPTVKEGVV
jgi:ornithine carbamoyltransferase